jgi:hypothetical protein
MEKRKLTALLKKQKMKAKPTTAAKSAPEVSASKQIVKQEIGKRVRDEEPIEEKAEEKVEPTEVAETEDTELAATADSEAPQTTKEGKTEVEDKTSTESTDAAEIKGNNREEFQNDVQQANTNSQIKHSKMLIFVIKLNWL